MTFEYPHAINLKEIRYYVSFDVNVGQGERKYKVIEDRLTYVVVSIPGNVSNANSKADFWWLFSKLYLQSPVKDHK